MTQFVLAKASSENDSLKAIEQLQDEFLMEAASKLFPHSSSSEIYILNINNSNIDSLMVDAQRAVIGDGVFKDTDLYIAIEKIVESIDELVFWYGSDYDDLECVDDIPRLLNLLELSVNDSCCEAYIHYKRVK